MHAFVELHILPPPRRTPPLRRQTGGVFAGVESGSSTNVMRSARGTVWVITFHLASRSRVTVRQG